MNCSKTLGIFSIIVFINSGLLWSQKSSMQYSKAMINIELEESLKQSSQIDTISTFAGESKLYKNIFGILKIRIRKGLSRNELVYKHDSLLYSLSIQTVIKKNRRITTHYYNYYKGDSLVKYEVIKSIRKKPYDKTKSTQKNTYYLANGKVIDSELDEKHPMKMSDKWLKTILKNSTRHLSEFEQIRNLKT